LKNELFPELYSTDPGTDYSNDPVEYYSGNNSFFNLDMINGLLCLLDKLQITDLVNQGAYIARMQDSICDQNSSDDGQSSANSAYDEVTVISQRADNQSPHLVKMWLELNDPYYSSTEPGAITPKILVEATIRESVSDSNPFGVFDFNYSIIVDASLHGGTAGEEMLYTLANFRAFLSKENKPHFEFTYEGGNAINENITDQTIKWSSVVELNEGQGDSGRSKNYIYSSVSNSYEFESLLGADFNAGYLMTATNDTNNPATQQQCLSRTESFSNVIDYNLYHATDSTFHSKTVQAGQRVELNTSIYFTFNEKHGTFGSWGYWLEGGELLPDQTTIVDTQDSKTYTVQVSPGKLSRTDSRSGSTQFQTVIVTDSELFGQPNQVSTFYCYFKCPRGGVTQESINNSAGIQDLYYNYSQSSQTPYTYTISVENYKILLKDNSNGDALVDFSQLELSTFNIDYIRSGILYSESRDINPSPDVYYTWNSGPAEYAQLATLTDSNSEVVTFDNSLSFVYLHDAANDRYNNNPTTNPFHGQELNLYYYGAGELWGFPDYEIDPGTVLQVGLNDGVTLENNDGVFITKATGIIEYSTEKDISECSGLNADAVLTDSGLVFLDANDLQAISFTAADEPTVTEAPRVIDGVLQ
jgi:hypothetical protein